MTTPHGIRIGLLGLPFDWHSSFMTGTAKAPPLIRKALISESTNCYSETGIAVDGSLLVDCGDAEIGRVEAFSTGITDAVQGVLARGLLPLCLGGDHSVTWPIMACLGVQHHALTIIHFDAHTDLYADFEGNPFSHASPFARIMERFPHFRLIQIGIRTHNPHTRKQAKRFGVEVMEMKNFDPDLEICSTDPIYISFDLDGLDPAFAPGVSHHEPGGLSTRQALDIIHRLKGRIIGADVVEYNPIRDVNGVTAMVAARLVKEIAGMMVLSHQPAR